MPRLAFACATLAVAASVAGAQQAESPRLSVAVRAGGTVPTGFSRLVDEPGGHVGLAAELRTPLPWLTARLDAAAHQFGDDVQAITTGPGGADEGELRHRTRMVSASAGVALRLPGLRSAVRPYALAGVGLYRAHDDLRTVGTTSPLPTPLPPAAWRPVRVGVSGGAGLEGTLGPVTAFAEARYERVSQGSGSSHAMELVPISIGVRF